MLFLNKPINSAFLDGTTVQRFKDDYNAALEDLDSEDGIFISPFADSATRNGVSRNSFIIADSLVQEDNVVRVEVPHFEMCENIPLRKTPIFCSHNRSINFSRVAGDDNVTGCFDLYRLRFNTMFLLNKEAAAKAKRDYNVITADFVDISILDRADAENADFWKHGTMISVFDPAAKVWIEIPDMNSMLYDLYKMLHVYDCPESKREKRQMRWDALKVTAGFPLTSFGRATGCNFV
jgi:hypothetical protein